MELQMVIQIETKTVPEKVVGGGDAVCEHSESMLCDSVSKNSKSLLC